MSRNITALMEINERAFTGIVEHPPWEQRILAIFPTEGGFTHNMEPRKGHMIHLFPACLPKRRWMDRFVRELGFEPIPVTTDDVAALFTKCLPGVGVGREDIDRFTCALANLINGRSKARQDDTPPWRLKK